MAQTLCRRERESVDDDNQSDRRPSVMPAHVTRVVQYIPALVEYVTCMLHKNYTIFCIDHSSIDSKTNNNIKSKYHFISNKQLIQLQYWTNPFFVVRRYYVTKVTKWPFFYTTRRYLAFSFVFLFETDFSFKWYKIHLFILITLTTITAVHEFFGQPSYMIARVCPLWFY
jgi:hypothetical protein